MADIKYQLLYDTLPNAVFVSDLETGQILHCNPVAVQVAGIPKSQLLSMTRTDLWAPIESGNHHDPTHECTKNGHTVNYQANLLAGSVPGLLVQVNMSTTKIDGKKVAIQILTYIEERQQASSPVESKGTESTKRKSRRRASVLETSTASLEDHERASMDRAFESTDESSLTDNGEYARPYTTELDQRIVDAVIEERNRLAREIHDTLVQNFVGIILHLEAAHSAVTKETAKAQWHIGEARMLARQGLNEARHSVQNLQPLQLQQLPLVDTLRREVKAFADGTGVKASFDTLGEALTLPSDIETSLLRICQEALTNVKKHAMANSVEVKLIWKDDCTRLSISDNGIAFNPRLHQKTTYGLTSMEQRAHLLGGDLVIRSNKGRGTSVEVCFPRTKDSSSPNLETKPLQFKSVSPSRKS